MSSSTSKVPESSSDPKDLDQQESSRDEGSDQLKKGGEADPVEGEPAEEAGGAEEDEEGECGFCLYMKGGGCKDAFTAWEKCVEEAEKTREDVVDKCSQVTTLLKVCMEAHYDYYQPILAAEKAAEAQVTSEMQTEAANSDSPAATEEQAVAFDSAEGFRAARSSYMLPKSRTMIKDGTLREIEETFGSRQVLERTNHLKRFELLSYTWPQIHHE